MNFTDEVQLGEHTYALKASTQTTEDEQGNESATVAVEFTGADADGQIVAEGNMLIGIGGVADTSKFVTRTLDGLGTMSGERPSARSSRSRPPNAGQPWTEELNEQLRQRWMQQGESVSANALLGELAPEFGRSRSSIRAQVARMGCDPDVPGRLLMTSDDR